MSVGAKVFLEGALSNWRDTFLIRGWSPLYLGWKQTGCQVASNRPICKVNPQDTCHHNNNFDEVLLLTRGQRAMNFFFILHYHTSTTADCGDIFPILEIFFSTFCTLLLQFVDTNTNLFVYYTHICWIGGGRCWRNYFVYLHRTYNFSFIFFLN